MACVGGCGFYEIAITVSFYSSENQPSSVLINQLTWFTHPDLVSAVPFVRTILYFVAVFVLVTPPPSPNAILLITFK